MPYNTIYPPYSPYEYRTNNPWPPQPKNIPPNTVGGTISNMPLQPQIGENQIETPDSRNTTLNTIMSHFNIPLQLDDLILYGILLFLFFENCTDWYLYIAIILILLDLDLTNLIDL